MLDFLVISTRSPRKGEIEIFPKFVVKKSEDLMTKGGDFYAIWNDELSIWSTDENIAIQLIDRELNRFYKENYQSDCGGIVKVLYTWDSDSGVIDKWHKYVQKQLRDSFHTLDEKIVFANDSVNKNDYSSKRLPYSLTEGSTEAYDKMMSVLYSEQERHKLEWAIGSVFNGDSKILQKFVVLYGSGGTGKSTVLNIIQDLFKGYYEIFDSKALGSVSNSFALEAFRSNPLVAIQHDGDLSKIEDNTRINSLVSHERMSVNVKFKSLYTEHFNTFLFMGTNKPVKITDAKSGIIRRLIDVSPTGEKIPKNEYTALVKQVNFELGAIAIKCKSVYESDPTFYDNYIPVQMLGASNDFYNFVADSYFEFIKMDSVPLKIAWEMYCQYCADAKVQYPMSQRLFKEELRNYFDDFKDRMTLSDGSRVRNCYSGFLASKFDYSAEEARIPEEIKENRWLLFDTIASIFDSQYPDYPAQYASEQTGGPKSKWSNTKTTLKDIDTAKLHYVKVPTNHIVIDFDIKDSNGNKSLEENINAANKWPKTYAELSKSGQGIHLHYIYDGDPATLCNLYSNHIEIKVFNGDSSLRRMVTKCNDMNISNISSGLPVKELKMVSNDVMVNEKAIRTIISKNLRKEYHSSTKSSIDFINKILNDAYSQGVIYNVTNMRASVLAFATLSTNNSDYCINLVNKMKFCSESEEKCVDSMLSGSNEAAPIVFYDVEIFPNLFVLNWKFAGKENPVVRMINPSPDAVSELFKYRLIGFNNRKYDNHIIYARSLGYTLEALYELSQKIVNGSKNVMFPAAYNLSYADIYDFSSEKQSLKKFEIALGIHHQELGLPWDKPVPEELWPKVCDYCVNDVEATEAVFYSEARQADFVARQILAKLTNSSVNDTTRTLCTRFIFGDNKTPQSEFNYRNMGEVDDTTCNVQITKDETLFSNFGDSKYTLFNALGQPVFPGYKYEFGKSTYRGDDVGEGGYVYAEPGVYFDTVVLDIASMHPTSLEEEVLFGERYTKRYSDVKSARIFIKHGDYDSAKKLLDGALIEFLDDKRQAENLAQALKIIINSIYGYTCATFDNPFKDKRNIDNIVAKRGALFMINLKFEVQNLGFTVAHVKTDSIKIPNATPEIIQFVMDYGKMYGYTFEHESTYERMCLVNNAVYIAKYASIEWCQSRYGYIPDKNKKKAEHWTATGTQFAVPYVFKTLFSHEDITINDLCETKQVSTGSIYLDFNDGLTDPTPYEKELERITKKLSSDAPISEETVVHIHELEAMIASCHNYVFVGRVGLFCPVKTNGGELYRECEGKYYAVTGTKGYRWVETETFVNNNYGIDTIDLRYYETLAQDAYDTISKYDSEKLFFTELPF